MGDRLQNGMYETIHPSQLSLAIPPWVGAMSTSVSRHTARCSSPVSVVGQCKLVSGWGLRQRRSAQSDGPWPTARERLCVISRKDAQHLVATSQPSHVRLGAGFQLSYEDSASLVQTTCHVEIQHFIAIGPWQYDVTTHRSRRPTNSKCTLDQVSGLTDTYSTVADGRYSVAYTVSFVWWRK